MINMNAFNDNGNIKQFQLTRMINEKCSDEHTITKISIVLRRDKIEAPYYMVTKIKVSSCSEKTQVVKNTIFWLLKHRKNLSGTTG